MKAIVYDGIQKVDCREVADPKIEKDDEDNELHDTRGRGDRH